MNITLLPHQEKAIEAAIHAGVIHSVEEWIDSAISRLPQPQPNFASSTVASQATNLVDLFEPIRGLFEDGELDFSRNPSTGRSIDLT